MIALLSTLALAQDSTEPVPVPVPAPVPEAAPEPAPEPVAEPAPAPEPVPVPVPVPPPVDPGPVYMGSVPAPPPRDPPRVELSAEIGALNNSDVAYDLFSSGDAMPSYGFKAGYRLAERVAAVASWGLVRHGQTLIVGASDDDGDFEDETDAFVAALIGHELTLGAKADVSIEDVLLPYVSTQGLVMIAEMRFDDEPTDRDNPGQVSASAMTGGFLATAGAELRFPPRSPVAAAWYLEMGYGWLARASFGELGTMKPTGFAVRSGVGVRF